MTKSKDPTVTVELTRDEAIVIFEWAQRMLDDQSSTIGDRADELAISNLVSLLEKNIDDIFSPRYLEVLADAKARLVADISDK